MSSRPPARLETTLGDVRSHEQVIRRTAFAVGNSAISYQGRAWSSVVIRPLSRDRRGGRLAWMRSMSEGRIRLEGLPGATPARDVGLRAGSSPWAGKRRSVKARLLRPSRHRVAALSGRIGSLAARSGVAGVRREPLRAFAPQGLTERPSCARALTALLFTTEGKVKLCGGI
jgi:hypothetical protein